MYTKIRAAFIVGMTIILAACSAPTPTSVPVYNPYIPTATSTSEVYNPYISSNTSTPPLPTQIPTATQPPLPNDYIVIAQLNLWFNGPGCNGGFEAFDCSGKRTTPLTPALGAT